MKKLILVVAVILGMTTTSQGQQALRDGQLVDGRSHKKIVNKLDIDFEAMSVEGLKPYEVVDVFKVVFDVDTIYEYIGDKFRFSVTDDKWNHLELEMFIDNYEQVTFKGKYNGEAFHLENDKVIFDESKKDAWVSWNLR